MLSPQYPIETERLLLRPFQPADVDDVHAYQSRDDVCRYIPYQPRSRAEVVARMDPSKSPSVLHHAGEALFVAAQLRATGQVIGDLVLFWRSAEHRTGEIGYVFNPEHSGRGYATEAARAVVGLGFDGLGLRRVIARVEARNAASAAVARRLGMRQEAHFVENEWFKGEWADELVFAILDREWSALAASRT
jgi:RimJ/RimL family protein N-acetyltransferase